MGKKAFPLLRVYTLLEPGPVVLLTTSHKGKANVMTLSWHLMMEFEPPMVGCVVSEQNFTFAGLLSTGECVLNIPTVELAEKVVGCGNTSGRSLDKFKAYGLTPVAASRVGTVMIDECFANLECRVRDRGLVEKYDLFIMEVVKAWVDPAVKNPRTLHHRGWGEFMVAGDKVKLPSRMR